jgi:hypothetical protein
MVDHDRPLKYVTVTSLVDLVHSITRCGSSLPYNPVASLRTTVYLVLLHYTPFRGLFTLSRASQAPWDAIYDRPSHLHPQPIPQSSPPIRGVLFTDLLLRLALSS